VGLVFAIFFALAMLAELDNRVKWQAGHDARSLRELQVGARKVDAVISANYKILRWEAFHADDLFRTVVTCYAQDHAGREVVLSWEVAHWFSPYPGVPRKGLFVTALTGPAASLTPDYAVPGLDPSEYPEPATKFSEVLYGFASKNWMDGHPPLPSH
jgi:hypothetical protein